MNVNVVLTGQFAEKPARGQSSRGLVNSHRKMRKCLENHEKTTLRLYTEPIEY